MLGPSTNHLCVVTGDHVQIATLSVSSLLQPAVYKFGMLCIISCIDLACFRACLSEIMVE